MSKRLEYNATVTSRIDLEPTLAVFRVKPDLDAGPPRDPSWFVPGQYLTIGLNRPNPEDEHDPRPLSVRRPMSIASCPQDTDEIEFYIRRVANPDSSLPLTHLMWPLQAGDRMYVRMTPAGKFTLDDTIGIADPRLHVFVAAGTGLAPFLSIIRWAARRDPDESLDRFILLQGASYPGGLGYRDELEAFARERGLRYVPTISRPDEVPTWTGSTGRAERLLLPSTIESTEERLGLATGTLRPERAVVFICGLTGTVATAVSALLERGFTPDHRRLRRALSIGGDTPSSIFWEQYDSAPVLDVKDEVLMGDLGRRYAAARPNP